MKAGILFLILGGHLESFTIEYNAGCGLFIKALYPLEEGSVSSYVWMFLSQVDVDFFKFLFCINLCRDNHVPPTPPSVLWMWYITLIDFIRLNFPFIHLVMVYNPFQRLLNLVSSYFVEDYFIYLHKGYWSITLFPYDFSLTGFGSRVMVSS